MSQVIIENGAMRGRRQQTDDPNGVFGHEIVTGAGAVLYPYGLGVTNSGGSSRTCLPGLLFRTKLRLNATSGARLHGTAGSAYLTYNPSVSTRAAGYNVAANSTSSKACTGVVHDLTLTYTANNSYNYAIPEHAATSMTVKLNANSAAFPAIRRGARVYFAIPCAWGYPYPNGSRFPAARIEFTKPASTYLTFFWRANGVGTQRDIVTMNDPARFTISCEPFGINVEYRVGEGLSEIAPDRTIAGVVCTNNTNNQINLILTDPMN